MCSRESGTTLQLARHQSKSWGVLKTRSAQGLQITLVVVPNYFKMSTFVASLRRPLCAVIRMYFASDVSIISAKGPVSTC